MRMLLADLLRTGPAAPGAVMFMRSSKEAMVKERKGRGRLSVGAYSLEKKDKSTRSTATNGAVEIAAFGCGIARASFPLTLVYWQAIV